MLTTPNPIRSLRILRDSATLGLSDSVRRIDVHSSADILLGPMSLLVPPLLVKSVEVLIAEITLEGTLDIVGFSVF